MSFYGNIKRIPASPWVFDKIYSNRKSMETEAINDAIHIGRYVLVNYRLRASDGVFINKWIKIDEEGEDTPQNLRLTNTYYTNENTDIQTYNNTFDLTVWQKIFSAGVDKYILVAELKSGVPRLELETISPIELQKPNTEVIETWTEPSLVPQANISQTPQHQEYYETENTYKYYFPAPLKIELDSEVNNILGGENFVKPNRRLDAINGSHDFTNRVQWIPGQYNENQEFVPLTDAQEIAGTKIDGKKLDIQLYGVGKAIRDLYDVLFGLPADGKNGERQGYPRDTDGELSLLLDDAFRAQGLYGVLRALNIINSANETDADGNWIDEQRHLYFVTRWGDATDNNSAFIQNLPKVITSSSKRTSGHYKVVLTDPSSNYLQSP